MKTMGRSLGGCLLVLFFVIILVPTLMVKGCDVKISPGKEPVYIRYLNVFNHKTNELMKMDLEDYLVGVVAAEMPASFHLEALKAQAVAARTYTVRKMISMGGRGCVSHTDADVCTDHNHCQAWMSNEGMRERWGYINYLRYKEKIEEAVTSTRDQIITYNNLPIDAIYHSTSGGKTENSEDVWANSYPYLRSVISPHEVHSPRFVETVEIPIIDFLASLKALNKDFKVTTDPLDTQMAIVDNTVGGKVKRIRIGNQIFTGVEVRKALQLNSAGFTYKVSPQHIRITTTGYGHGVGMSQYGADGYAKEGWNYREILLHYYTGTQIHRLPAK